MNAIKIYFIQLIVVGGYSFNLKSFIDQNWLLLFFGVTILGMFSCTSIRAVSHGRRPKKERIYYGLGCGCGALLGAGLSELLNNGVI